MEKKQLNTHDFSAAYSLSKATIYRLINRRDDPLPAYKQGSNWYIDIDEYKAWREREHQRCYKYADGQRRYEA
ncbi:MAG: helix-turn-helix domain-containing protein [Clostridiales bacterium]|nr:helix-turn-helix domain-containing protein [Clostridiales bacterium]